MVMQIGQYLTEGMSRLSHEMTCALCTRLWRMSAEGQTNRDDAGQEWGHGEKQKSLHQHVTLPK